jgi:MinD-like ATPase involved in chromosome partitioning or flagellar assembly
VALLTPNALTAAGIEQLTQESGLFKLVFKGSPIPPVGTVMRALSAHGPEVILLDLGDWDSVSVLAKHIKESKFRGVTIGFRPVWDRQEQLMFEEAGIPYLVRDPFSPADIEAVAYEAIHRKRPVTHENILAFLPAKAGGGCSTVVLNTAAALTQSISKSVLLIEADRRSGVLSIMLNQQARSGLAEALAQIGEMTPVEWQQHCVSAFGMHLLLADPSRRGALPSWADYYQLLRFVQTQYEYVLVDLPEVVNQATAEVVKSARGVFIVCTPEIPSLRMAGYRCAELEACAIPRDNVHIVLNRWESGRLSIPDIEGILERPVFGTLPNDYAKVKKAIIESRLVSPNSKFAEGCRTLAQKLSGLPGVPQERSQFELLRRLGRMTD